MKIIAVVVTFNRLELLKSAVTSLQNQTLKVDEIIVVNNDSNDGTLEWLATRKDLIVINQGNVGGAGGQNSGIRRAISLGADFVWCLDDDGKPAEDCLYHLYHDFYKVKGCGAIGPTVLNIEDHQELAFEHNYKNLELLRRKKDLLKYLDKDGIFHERANFFNGILISKEAILKVGYPKSEMFIWGDELEYNHRIIAAGFKVVSTIKAIFYHPKDRIKYKRFRFLGAAWTISDVGGKRDYLAYRNYAYISYKYFGISGFLKFMSKNLLYTLANRDFKKALTLFKASFNGVTNNFKRVGY